MNEEQLKSYKKHLASFSKEDLEKRDYYLSALSGGTIKLTNPETGEVTEGQLQGPSLPYASITQPWLAHFNIDVIHSINNTKTIYQDILDANKDHLDEIAIEYFGAKITYGELISNSDKAAKALVKSGVKEGDYVTVICAGNPELIYTVYALAKIGAAANLMAPYFDHDQMVERINDCKSTIAIIMDKFYKPVKGAIEKSNIKKIISVQTLNSSPLNKLPHKKLVHCDNKKIYDWNFFLEDAKDEPEVKTFEYKKDYPLCLVYSSGTTGASKAIVLTHDSFQNSVLSYDANKFDIIRGNKMYQIIPPWYSTGLNTSIHLALHGGVIVFQDPRFERDVFVKNIIKYGIDYAVAPTSMFEGFLDKKLTRSRKLDHLANPFEGGEPLSAKVKFGVEASWKEMGCNSSLNAGYGQCECGATVTSPSQYINHHLGSVALPIPGVKIGIFDDNDNELPYNTRGNIYVATPCGMKEYFNNPKATEEYFFYDGYGNKWSRTGDIGMIAPNGDLFVNGRNSDYIIINDKKIYNFDIEMPIMELNDIKNCDCLPVNINGEEKQALHIIFNDNVSKKYKKYEELNKRLKELQVIIYNECSNIDAVPEFFKIRKEFPYKPSGKRDTESLKKETDSFIYVDKSHLLKRESQRIRK